MFPASGPWANLVWPWSRPALQLEPAACPLQHLQQLGHFAFLYHLLFKVLGASSVLSL